MELFTIGMDRYTNNKYKQCKFAKVYIKKKNPIVE